MTGSISDYPLPTSLLVLTVRRAFPGLLADDDHAARQAAVRLARRCGLVPLGRTAHGELTWRYGDVWGVLVPELRERRGASVVSSSESRMGATIDSGP